MPATRPPASPSLKWVDNLAHENGFLYLLDQNDNYADENAIVYWFSYRIRIHELQPTLRQIHSQMFQMSTDGTTIWPRQNLLGGDVPVALRPEGT